MATTVKSLAAGARTKLGARPPLAPDLTRGVSLAKVDPLLGAIYEGATEAPPWRGALELLRDTLFAKHVTLMRSIQLHARLDFLECERQLFAGTVNRMLLGMISFDQGGAILETNTEARRILAEKDGISVSGNNLVVHGSTEGRELQRMIKQA